MVSVHATISDLGAFEWNRLADSNAFAAHGWLLSMERAWKADCQPLYFALRRNGTLCAAAVCYVMRASPGVETLDDMLFGRLASVAARVGVSFLPALVCGPAQGYGWHIGVDPELDGHSRSEHRREVLDAIESEADRRGLSLSFAQVLDEEQELRDLLAERGYLTSRNVPIARLDVAWSSMDGYFSLLPSRRRREFRREIRRNAEADVTIEVQKSCAGLEDRLLELLEQTARAHGGAACPFGREIFPELEANMGAEAMWLVARKAGRISGALLALQLEKRMAAFAIGVDNHAADGDFTYFQLCYTRLIEHAIRHGVERIDYGRGMYEVKVRRGCRLIGASLYTRMTGPSRPLAALWYSVASRWNQFKLSPAVRREIGSRAPS